MGLSVAAVVSYQVCGGIPCLQDSDHVASLGRDDGHLLCGEFLVSEWAGREREAAGSEC